MTRQEARKMKQLARGLQVVPNGAADISTKNCWVFKIVVANTDSSACTLLIKDKQTSPLELVPTVSLDANSLTIMNFEGGVLMKGGINWVAGTADKLRAEVEAYEEVG